MEDREEIIAILRSEGIISGDKIKVRSLDGGVSSDIWLLESKKAKFVVKRALSKLRVDDYWVANTRRNIAEQHFIRFLSSWSKTSVPTLIFGDVENAFLVIPYYGPPWITWKSQLMKGVFNQEVADRSASMLAAIHSHSFGQDGLLNQFANKQDFYDLRIEPYLVSTGERNSSLKSFFEEEADRLMHVEIALMHGDFSPKNILVDGSEIMILDHEVACFGDPAFDLAFFINHLMLKNILHPKAHLTSDLAEVAWQSYFQHLAIPNSEELKERSSRLWLMLMLARVDGKSPVPYLNTKQKVLIRDFVHEYLLHPKANDFLFLRERFYHALPKKQDFDQI